MKTNQNHSFQKMPPQKNTKFSNRRLDVLDDAESDSDDDFDDGPGGFPPDPPQLYRQIGNHHWDNGRKMLRDNPQKGFQWIATHYSPGTQLEGWIYYIERHRTDPLRVIEHSSRFNRGTITEDFPNTRFLSDI